MYCTFFGGHGDVLHIFWWTWRCTAVHMEMWCTFFGAHGDVVRKPISSCRTPRGAYTGGMGGRPSTSTGLGYRTCTVLYCSWPESWGEHHCRTGYCTAAEGSGYARTRRYRYVHVHRPGVILHCTIIPANTYRGVPSDLTDDHPVTCYGF